MFVLFGLALIGFGIWEIYCGRANFWLIGSWWMWPEFDRDEHPGMFWFCIFLDFLAAGICFAIALSEGMRR